MSYPKFSNIKEIPGFITENPDRVFMRNGEIFPEFKKKVIELKNKASDEDIRICLRDAVNQGMDIGFLEGLLTSEKEVQVIPLDSLDIENELLQKFRKDLSSGKLTVSSNEILIGNLVKHRGLFNTIEPFKNDQSLLQAITTNDTRALRVYFNTMQVTGNYIPFNSFKFNEAKLRQRVSIADKMIEPGNETQEKIKKLQQLSRKFSAIQQIAGDGNCYYRAIIRGYVEQSIMASDQDRLERFERLATLIGNMIDRENPLFPEIQELVAKLRQAGNKNVWPNLKDFWRDLVESDVDSLLIQSIRYLLAKHCVDHRNDELENGFTLWDVIGEQAGIDAILTMGQDAEGGHVELGILPTLLNYPCNIYFLSSNPRDSVNFVANPALQTDFQGNILLSDRHYDSLLTPEIEERMQQNQEMKAPPHEEKMQLIQEMKAPPHEERMQQNQEIKASKERLMKIINQYQSQSWLAWILSCIGIKHQSGTIIVLQQFLTSKAAGTLISLTELENEVKSEKNNDRQKQHRYNLFKKLESANTTGTDSVIENIKKIYNP